MSRDYRAVTPIQRPWYGSDTSLRGLSSGIEAVQEMGQRRGVIGTPRQGLVRILGRHAAGGNASEDVMVHLSEGIFDIYGNLTVPWSNLHIRGAGRSTVLRRAATPAATTDMLIFNGQRVTVEDLAVDDEGGAAYAALKFLGPYATVRRVWFTHCGYAVHIQMFRGRVEDCDLLSASTAGDWAIYLTGTGWHAVSGNRSFTPINNGNGDFIYAADSVAASSYVGNVATTGVGGARSCVSYKTDATTAQAGNVGGVTVRP